MLYGRKDRIFIKETDIITFYMQRAEQSSTIVKWQPEAEIFSAHMNMREQIRYWHTDIWAAGQRLPVWDIVTWLKTRPETGTW